MSNVMLTNFVSTFILNISVSRETTPSPMITQSPQASGKCTFHLCKQMHQRVVYMSDVM